MPKQDYYWPTRQLVNQANASIVGTPRIPRSRFIGSWTRKTAFDAGYLVPILCQEVMPGDHMSYDVNAYVRMATPIFPMLDNQRIQTDFFFVPMRLTWGNFKVMMGEQATPATSIDLEVPTVPLNSTNSTVGSLYDHFGIPTTGQLEVGQTLDVNAMPFRAYNLIWNTWYRDQNLQDEVDMPYESDGPDNPADYVLLRRAKFHDYFTSALPWPQKFDSPTIPLLGTAPVTGIGWQGQGVGVDDENWLETGGTVQYDVAQVIDDTGTTPATLRVGINLDEGDGSPLIFADLAQAAGVNMADFRQSVLLQELLERDARGGTRYTEIVRHHFGVVSPDARQQRPEYIGGGSTPLNVTPIAQTAPSTTEPVGTLGGAGTAAGQHRCSYAATEHGYIIGLISVRSELSYQQGLHRMWTRQNRYDFPWPALAGLSEQAILRREIFATGNGTNDDAIWGYQERYHEYRTQYSEVTGIMRSTAASTIDNWHLAQEFSPAPALNSAFIQETPPMTRVLAAGSAANGQQYIADILYNRTAVRPLPTYGIPASLSKL